MHKDLYVKTCIMFVLSYCQDRDNPKQSRKRGGRKDTTCSKIKKQKGDVCNTIILM